MNLFNFENMINENYSFSDCLHSVQTDEVYLHRTLKSLTKLNEATTSSIKKLGVSILEAESRKEENQCFCVAFEEFKNAIMKFISDTNITVGKFSIDLDNIINANKDLLDDDYINNYDGCIDQYQVKGYTHLSDDFPSISPILIYRKEFDKIGKLMQDIGPLAPNDAKLQIIASVYNEFSKEISTDWNDKFIKEIFGETANSDNYAEVLYASFRKESECKPVTKSMLFNAKNVLMGYNTLVDSTTSSIKKVLDEFEKIALDIESMVFRNEDCKLRINTPTDGIENRDYQLDEYSINQFDIFMKAKISQVVQICNLYSIAISIKLDAIKEYVNSNKDLLEKANECCKCSCDKQPEEVSDDTEDDIETPEETPDEVENQDHDDDSSDITVDDMQDDFYDDHKELPTAEEPDEGNNTEDSEDDIDNTTEEDEDSDEDDNEIADDTSDTFYDDDSISSATKPDDEQPISEDPEETKEPDEMDTAEADNSDIDDIEKESYLMDYHLFTLDRILEQEDIINTLTEAMVLEDGEQQPAQQSSGDNNANLNSDLLKNAKGIDLVHFLIAQIKKLYNMFNQKFVVNIDKKKKLLINNKQYIIGAQYKSMKDIADKQKSRGSDGNAEEFKTLQHVNPDALSNAKVSDFEVRVDNYNNDDIKNKFESDASFFKAAYGDIAKNFQAEGNVSINKYIETLMISGENVTWDQCDHSNFDVEKMFEWCTDDMKNIMDNLNKQFNQIMKLESKLSVVVKSFEKQAATNGAQQVSQQTNQNNGNNEGGSQKQESYSLSSTMNDYFAEATAGSIPSDVKKQAGDAASQFNKMLKIYISVNSKVLSGEMSGYHKIFNEFFSLLNIVSKFNGRPSEQKADNGQKY